MSRTDGGILAPTILLPHQRRFYTPNIYKL